MNNSVFGIKSFRSGLAVGLTSLILTACGGGGGGDVQRSGPGNPVEVSVTGSVVKGHIRSGTVTVYRLLDNASFGEQMATAKTDEDGEYGLRLNLTEAQIVALVIEDGEYVDEATGNVITLQAGNRLEAYVRVPNTGEVSVNVTPLTTLAAAMVRQRMASGEQSLGDAVTYANTYVSSAFNVGNIASTAIPTLGSLGSANQFQRNYALLLAGFSQLDANDINQNVFEILGAMVADMEADGELGNDANAPTPGQLVLAVNQFLAGRDDLQGIALSNEVIKQFNIAPSAVNDAATVAEDGSISINVLGNDSDVNGDVISVKSINTDGIAGSVVINANGSLTYTPPANFNGQEIFTYTLKDNHNAESIAEVIVTVTPVNDQPVALSSAGTLSVFEDDINGLEGFLIATDIDGDDLKFKIINPPSLGTVVLDDKTGKFIYKPKNNVTGLDTFTFVANDGTLDSDIKTVSIQISAVNDRPIAVSGSLEVEEGAPTTSGQLVARDEDSPILTYSIVTQPTKGTLTLTNSQTGAFTYTPNPFANGADSFSFKANDGTFDSNTAIFQVIIRAVNDAPKANDDVKEVNEDTKLTLLPGNLTGNDTDPDGDTLHIVGVNAIAHGKVLLQDGHVIFTPDADYFGQASFTYTVSDRADGTGKTAIATVIVNVISVNDAPIANSDVASTNEDIPLVLLSSDLVANDTDIENDILSVSAVASIEGLTHGTVSLVDGKITYTPAQDYFGTAQFRYTVTDNATDPKTATATVSVTVNPVQDRPIADAALFTVQEDSIGNVGTLTGSDIDGDAITYSLYNGTTKVTTLNTALGYVELTNPVTGSFSYTPNPDASGLDDFSFVTNDGIEDSLVTRIDISIMPVNDAPSAETKTIRAMSGVGITGRLWAKDLEGDALTFEILGNGSKGTAVIIDSNTGSFTYSNNWSGPATTDIFTYQVSDTEGGTAIGTMNVEIEQQPESVMVVVAHPEDGVLMASGVMKRTLDAGASLKVVMMTNADDTNQADGYARQQEVVDALAIIGVPEQDIIFLGYPSDPNNGLQRIYNNHLTDAGTDYTSTRTGLSNTYGKAGLGLRDYHRYRTGESGGYNKETVLGDLVDVIQRYRPGHIYTHSIADQAYDHRITYHYIVDALAAAMKADSQYRADVYTSVMLDPKGFPYTYFVGGKIAADKWPVSLNPPAPVVDWSVDKVWPAPAFTGTSGNVADMQRRFTPDMSFSMPPSLGLTEHLWEDRISAFVPVAMQSTALVNNPKFHMIDTLQTHKITAGWIYGFGKNDEIFWRKQWTKNIALIADISTTSEFAETMQLAKNVADGIIDGFLTSNDGYFQGEWSTAGGKDVGESLTMTWPRPYTVNKIRLYDRPSKFRQIKKAKLVFSDGSSTNVAALNDSGLPYELVLDPPKTIDSMTFQITEVVAKKSGGAVNDPGYVGLAELEVFGSVAISNHSPLFTYGPVASQYSLGAGVSTTLTTSAADRDGDTITYAWLANLGTISGTGSSVTYMAPPAGGTTDIVTVSISDGVNAPVTAQFAIDITTP